MARRLAIFGGTFNPIHRGHVEVARAALDELLLQEQILIPSAVPPHKAATDLASGEDRLAMCQLAVRDEPRIAVSDIELRSPPPSYTVNTLRVLCREHPETELLLLIGADMLQDFHLWHRYKEILELARLLTFPRPGVALGPLNELRAAVGDTTVDRILADALHTPLVDVNSTEIRRRVKAGLSISDLVPAVVEHYIRDHGLYA